MKELNEKNVLIGYKLKQLRISNGYTQNKIADLLKITSQHYGTLERGINAVSLESILKICDFYKIPVYSILGEINIADRKNQKEGEELLKQIDSLNNEHKLTIKHMIKFYTQLENKDEKLMKELRATRKMINDSNDKTIQNSKDKVEKVGKKDKTNKSKVNEEKTNKSKGSKSKLKENKSIEINNTETNNSETEIAKARTTKAKSSKIRRVKNKNSKNNK